MFTTIILCTIGLAAVIVGADRIVAGSSSTASRLGVSGFIIGLTIVAFGTSAPEMVVSFIGAVQGRADIAVGNIVGSNIFNGALILGISALVAPFSVKRKEYVPVAVSILAALLIPLCSWLGHGTITRVAGAVFLLSFIAYMVYLLKTAKDDGDNASEQKMSSSVVKDILYIVLGLGLLVGGGKLFVEAAEKLAHLWGWSDRLIAVTVLAMGTSLPELVTSAVAAIKGESGLAVGNVVGSNIFNILFILGGSSLITPLDVGGVGYTDLIWLCDIPAFTLVMMIGNGHRLNRFEGVVLVWAFLTYMVQLFK